MGRRVQKVVYLYGSGSWNQDKEVLFVYNGWNLVKETTVASGQTAVDKYYVWGLDLSQSLQGAGGVGGLLAAVEGSLTYHYLYDANGNVGQMIDAGDGSIAAHYEYDPYGNEVLATGSLAADNVYRFSTKYYDSESSLYYFGLRYYSSEIGRWINKDPIEERGGVNLYNINRNNLVNLIEFLGLAPADCKRCDALKGQFEFNNDMLEWNVKNYRKHLEEQIKTNLASEKWESAKQGVDPDGLGVDHYQWVYEQMHLPYLRGYEKKYGSLYSQKLFIQYYIKQTYRFWEEYQTCYKENECGGCLEWYCRRGNSQIGAGLDVASLLLATAIPEIGIPGAVFTYTLSASNDILTAHICHQDKEAIDAFSLDSLSVIFTAYGVGPAGALTDLVSLYVNLDGAFDSSR